MRRYLSMLAALGLLSASIIACRQPEPVVEPTAPEMPVEPSPVDEPDMDSGADASVDVMRFDPATPGGTLVVGQGQEPDQLYMYGGSMLAAVHVQHSLYDGPIEGMSYDYQPVILTKLPKLEDNDGSAQLSMVTVEPGDRYVDPETQEVVTATEQVQLEQITATFTIRDGVTWQDGTPVTAEDSVFSQRLACDPLTPSSKFTCDRTASYEAVGPMQTQWVGLPGFTDQTYFINFYTPLPRHQPSSEGVPMSEVAADAILQDEQFSRMPWSFGPFKITEWVAAERITLERNEHYWRREEGLPFLESVIHRFISDTNALLLAVQAGDVDVATQDGLDISQSDAMDQAASAGELVPHYVTGTVWEHIDFNLNPLDDRPPLGACREIRHAIARGTNRPQMVDVIQKGKTQVQHTFVPAEHWAFPTSDTLIEYAYDTNAAAAALDAFGFIDSDGDNVREAQSDITCTITETVDGATKDMLIPQGTPLSLELMTTSGNAMREETTLLFQQNMRDIGVDITLSYQPANVFFADGPDGPLFGRKFDLGEFAWLTGVQPPVGLYYCTEVPSPENNWAGQNQTGWCDPEYDRLGKQASATLERAASLPLYHQAQRIFMDNLPVIPLFARVKVMATAPNVVNFRPNATVNSELWNVETWGFSD